MKVLLGLGLLANHSTVGRDLALQVHKSLLLRISLRYVVQESKHRNLLFVSEKTAFETCSKV